MALIKVNKTLNLACNDPLVYKAIIENRNGNGGPQWQHHLPLSLDSPVSSWARYALADSKAACARTLSLQPAMMSWVPQLIAHHRQYFSESAEFSIRRLILSRSLHPLCQCVDFG